MSRSTVLVVEDERKIRDPVRPDLLAPAPTPAVSRWAVVYGVRRPRCDTTREQSVCEGAIA